MCKVPFGEQVYVSITTYDSSGATVASRGYRISETEALKKGLTKYRIGGGIRQVHLGSDSEPLYHTGGRIGAGIKDVFKSIWGGIKKVGSAVLPIAKVVLPHAGQIATKLGRPGIGSALGAVSGLLGGGARKRKRLQ